MEAHGRRWGGWILAAVVATFPATRSRAEEPPYELQRELLALLAAKTAKIDDETGPDGQDYRRGTYSKHFIPAGEGRWQVSFTKDAPGKERMRTDRYLLTLGKNAGGKWDVLEEELQDTYDGFVRDVPGDETFYRFDGVQIEREGLTITGGAGSLYTDTLLGEVDDIRFTAADLRFDYAPPADAGPYQRQVAAILKNENADKIVFPPERVTLTCDPGSCRQLLSEAFTGLVETDRASIGPVLEGAYAEMLDDLESARRDSAFSGFRQSPDPEQSRYRLAIKKSTESHWFVLSYDNHAASEVSVSVSDFGRLWSYPSEATRKAGVDPYEIESRDDEDARDFDLLGLVGTVEVALEDAELVEGDLTFTLRIKRDLQEIPFSFNDLNGAVGRRSSEKDPTISVDALQDGSGRDLTWVRFGSAGGLVVLPEPVSAGTEIDLRVRFQNKGSVIKFNSSYSYMDRGGWLPFVRYTDNIDRFDLTVRAPARYKVLGIGNLAEERREGDIGVTRWVAQRPVQFPTIIFGDYFEDKAKIEATRFDGDVIPVAIHVDKNGMSDWGIRPKQLRPLAEQAVNALNVYRQLYGVDYPYRKLDLVNDPLEFVSGQSPASVIYLGSAAFRSVGTLASAVVQSDDIIAATKTLVAHEVAHQWWGSSIGNLNTKNYWFVESLAEYSAALFLEIVESEGFQKPEKGRKAYNHYVERWRRDVLDTDLMAAVQDARTHWSNRGYRAALYAKGPYAFHVLRNTFDDEKFFQFLNQLGKELEGKQIVTRDIQRVAERAFGGVDADGNAYNVDLEWFFDQWIRGVGIPEYEFQYQTRQAEDGNWIVQGTIRQHVVLGTKKRELSDTWFRGVVPITIEGKDGELPARIVVDGPETPFGFKVPIEPRLITLNKYGEILAHDVIAPTPR